MYDTEGGEDLKLAVFDICGTLYFDNTTYSFLRWLSYKGIIKYNKRIMDVPYILRAINALLSLLFGKDYYRELQIRQLSGLSREVINNLAVEFVEDLEKNRVLSTNNLLAEYKRKGYTIVIASATIDPVANAIADKFGVDYFSSEMRFVNNLCTGKLEKDLLFLKKEALSHLIKKSEDTVIVTDNFTDLELIQISDHCHIVVRNEKDIEKWNKQLQEHLRKVVFIKKNSL